MLKSNNLYHNIPPLIIYICIAYYRIVDEFDADHISKFVSLNAKKNCITQISNNSISSSFLKEITKLNGVYHWKFKVVHCPTKANDSWSNTIGIWKCKMIIVFQQIM